MRSASEPPHRMYHPEPTTLSQVEPRTPETIRTNIVSRLLFLTALAFALSANAADIDLASKIAPGKWALTYQRTGELKPLHFKHKEEGTSYTCIDRDPRAKIVDWIQSKGCTIHEESLDGEVYRMRGECRLKWWKGTPIPVRVELRPLNRKEFILDIHTEGNTLLGFDEHTQASLQGPCDPTPQPDSPPKDKPEQSGQT